MIKKNYFKLIKNTENILFSKFSNFYTHCLASLYIHRGSLETKKKNSINLIKNFFFFIKRVSIFSYKIIFINSKIYKNINISKNKKNCFILTNAITSNLNKDFYFGNIDKYLEQKKISCIKIFKNFTNEKESIVWKNTEIKKNKIILPKSINLKKEIIFLYLAIKEYIRIKFLIINKKIKIDKEFYYLVSLNNFFSIIPTLRICYQMMNLIKLYSPKFVIITFEGHAWERALINSIKNYDKKIIIIAYQFSVLTKSHHSIFCNFNKAYTPHVIANSGKITKKLFKEKFINKHKVKNIVLGSCKYNKFYYRLKKNKLRILICPENLPNQILSMLNLAINLSLYYKKINFIFRFHPGLDQITIRNYLKQINKKPKNFSVSSNSLSVDLKNSSHILYKSTATVLEALNYNVIPIFFNQNKHDINENPLFFNKNIYYILNNVEDLQKIIKTPNKIKINKNISKNYFSQFNLDFIHNL